MIGFRSYEILVRGVEKQRLNQVLQEMKECNLPPSVVAYTKLLERLCDGPDGTLFITTLQEMIDNQVSTLFHLLLSFYVL